MALSLANIIVLVADMDRSVRFYRDQLGLEPITVSEHWSEFTTGVVTIALHPGTAAENTTVENGTHNGTLHLTFDTPDLDQTCAELRERGVTVDGPKILEGMDARVANFSDPDGVSYALQGR